MSSSETIREVTYWEHEIITVEPTERKPPQGKRSRVQESKSEFSTEVGDWTG